MSLTRILLRKGLESQRSTIVLSDGEPGYAIDSKRLYVGDGSTPGGVSVGTKFLGRVSFTPTGGVNYPTPVYPSYGDLIYETGTNLIYALTGTDWGQAGAWQAMGTNFNPDQITLTKSGTTVSVRTGGLSAFHFSTGSIGTGLTRTGGSNQILRIEQPTAELTFTGNQLSIANGGVTNTKLANTATNTVKARIATGTGAPSDIPLSTFSTVLSSFLSVAMPPGTFKFKVSNTVNGCLDSTEIVIQADTIKPLVIGGGDKFLTCAINTVTIGSALSDGGSGFNTRWSVLQSEEIQFFSQPSRKTQSITSPGKFRCVVENSRNGCKDSVTVNVGIDTILPRLTLPLSDTLNCVTGNATLKLTVSSLDRISFSWKAENGGFIGA